MERTTLYKCRWCKKENHGKLYCGNSCKSQYYAKLMSDNFNNKSPEEFIKEELNKPINKLYLKVEKVPFVPRKKAASNKFVELLELLSKEMNVGDVRRLQVEKFNNVSHLREICTKHFPEIKVFSRTIGENRFYYFEKNKIGEKIE